MGCNDRHHSIALLRGDATTTLHHFMLEAETLVGVGLTNDRCEAVGIVTTTLALMGTTR